MTPNPTANHCFGFEQDFVGQWRCIPLCVRRKLDLIGLKLKLNHWLAMSQAQRQDLVDWDDQPAALAAMAEHCRTLTRSMADGEAKPLPPAREEPWQLSTLVAAHVAAAASERGIALGVEQWQQLNELERFALCKLARPGHDHHNLEAAFSEVLG
ncbi:nitrate reductase associated protein [Synechococcus sp. HK05]|uniref:nitrate reductase associated protein n=1 Tax=Synechococcus sp. HK05 TaxID=2725975 RepID=UPI001C393F06|nr:nitrate reductase associated protein [Synechococcus sp. HK05]MBV2352307.1 nitrate reductase associated protein [Synechococcus sp. HK05]